MPVYVEKVKDEQTGKMVEKKVNGQKQYYIRTYITDEFGNKKQVTRHNKEWLGVEGKKMASWKETDLQNKKIISSCTINDTIEFGEGKPIIKLVDEAYEELINDSILYNKNGKSSRKTYDYRYYKYISPNFGNKDIFKLEKLDVENFIIKLKNTKKKYKEDYLDVEYINNILALLRRIYIFICKKYDTKQKLTFEPIRKDRDEIPNVSLNDLINSNLSISPIDWENFCKVIENEIKDTKDEFKKITLIKLQLLFACEYVLLVRVGEAQGLKYKNLVANSNIYILYEQWNKQLNELTPLKNRKARLLYLPEKMVEQFQSVYKYLKKKCNISENDFIFCSDSNPNRPISRNTIDRYRKKFCKLAGINYITNHEFRHAGISNAIHNEVDISAISDMAGHTKQVMLSTYVQTLKEANTNLISTLDSLYIPSKN